MGSGGYGVKPIGGKNKLSGPGLPAAEEPGILMGGSKWPGRLANKASAYPAPLSPSGHLV